jgi:hypothetical protein
VSEENRPFFTGNCAAEQKEQKPILFRYLAGRRNTQPNDIQNNDTQHNDTLCKGIIWGIQHNNPSIKLSVIMLIVVFYLLLDNTYCYAECH